MHEQMYWLSLDPGEKNVGWAAFSKDGSELGIGKVSGGLDPFMEWLEGLDPVPGEIIYENYRINPTIAHGFSKVLTVQSIGMIKSYARRHKIPLHEQPNTALKIGLKYVGAYTMYYDSKGKRIKHVDDEISALAHGTYFLQKHGVKKNRVSGT